MVLGISECFGLKQVKSTRYEQLSSQNTVRLFHNGRIVDHQCANLNRMKKNLPGTERGNKNGWKWKLFLKGTADSVMASYLIIATNQKPIWMKWDNEMLLRTGGWAK